MQRVVLFILFLSLPFFQFSQTLIYGKIIDSEGFELPGALITELKSENKTATDVNGEFRLTVQDSAKIKISFIGKKDTILRTSRIKGSTIMLKEDASDDMTMITRPMIHYPTIGYYGDINHSPFGFSLHNYFQRRGGYLSELIGSVNFSYKTNLKSNHNIMLSLYKFNVLDLRKYSLTVGAAYDYRNLSLKNQQSVTNDMYFILSNSILNYLQFSPGLIFRKENYDNIENNLGFYFSTIIYFPKISLSLTARIRYFGEYSENGFSVYQRLSKKHRILKHLSIGLSYDKFINHDEIGFNVLFTLK